MTICFMYRAAGARYIKGCHCDDFIRKKVNESKSEVIHRCVICIYLLIAATAHVTDVRQRGIYILMIGHAAPSTLYREHRVAVSCL